MHYKVHLFSTHLLEY